MIAVENRDGKSGRAYAQTIMDFSSRSLGKIFKTHIAKDAEVRSDGWTGYNPLKEEYPNLTQKLSNQGMNFQMLHNQIRNLKNWLRGVHSFCDREYIEHYLNEYFYRFNRGNNRESILEKTLNRMIALSPVTYRQIKYYAT